ncbi:MAG: PilZ domain-containing protein [Candidatus Omnitrophica bacterium]|nr:PilZ domain-containing protein [Candidatus Omnitrophota bacterium]
MSTKERRKYMRISTDLKAEYWAKGPSMLTGSVHIRDCSREGFGVSFPDKVGKGEHVDLTLRVPGDNIPIFATAEVTWSEEGKRAKGVNAGMKIITIKPLDLARLLDFVYSRWLGGIREAL